MAITITGGKTNLSTGLIHAVSGMPGSKPDNHFGIPVPARQGHQYGDKQRQRKQHRQVADCTKAEQRDHRFGRNLSARRLTQQANQLGGHQNREKRHENTRGRMGELPDCGTLKNHLVAGCLL
jgi:hypothetical protein